LAIAKDLLEANARGRQQEKIKHHGSARATMAAA
jgi:hypothetical protein